MAIAFENIPADLRVPLFYAELNSGGSPFDSQERLLLIGQKLTAGTAAVNEPILVPGGIRSEDALFGAGSMLAEMVRAARKNAPFQEIWALPLEDAGAGVKATATVAYDSLTLPVASLTPLTLYVGDRTYTIVVTAADDASAVAAAMAAEINADIDSPVVATVATHTMTLTARHAGTMGNFVPVTKNLVGGENVLTGEQVITATAGGSGDPDITTALAALGDEEFLWLAMPYADATNLSAMEDFLNDTAGRWSPIQQLYGHAFSVAYNTVGNLSTLGNGRNSQHVTIVGVNSMPSPPWSLVAAIGAKAGLHLSDPPELSRPLQFIQLQGIVAPRIPDRFSITDRNTLLYDGIASLRYDRTGAVQIERLITTYKTSSSGATDSTFLDVQTMAQAQYIIRFLRNRVLSVHGRQALASDGAPAINGVARPRDIRNTLIAGYAELASLAVVENQAAFERALVVERNAIDATRVDVLLPFDAVNQLRVLAMGAIANLQLQ